MENKIYNYMIEVLNVETEETECIRVLVPHTPVDVRKTLAEALIKAKLWDIQIEEDILEVLFTNGTICPVLKIIKHHELLAIKVATKEQKKQRTKVTSNISDTTSLLINN